MKIFEGIEWLESRWVICQQYEIHEVSEEILTSSKNSWGRRIGQRGPDTSFKVQNTLQLTGVEMQFFMNSPHLVLKD